MIDKSAVSKALGGHLSRYLEVLGLRPGATLDEINTTYYTLVRTIPQNPTEEEEARIHELKRAYDMLRRAYVPQPKSGSGLSSVKRIAAPAAGALVVVAMAVLVAMNYHTLRMKMVHYAPGTTLKLNSGSEPYGEVLAYEAQHHFPTGNPSGAYSIRLKTSGETVWVSERLAVNGMTRAH